jgi:adenylate cyclase
VLNPNLSWAWLFGGWVKLWIGEAEAAIGRFARGMRLSPKDSQNFALYDAIAAAHFIVGCYAEGLAWSKVALRDQPEFILATCIAVANASQAGRMEDAQKFLANLRRLAPHLRVSNLSTLFMPEFRRETDIARLVDGLRRAGLPE